MSGGEVRKVALRKAQGFIDEIGATHAEIDKETLKAEMTRLYVVAHEHSTWSRMMDKLRQSDPPLHRKLLALRSEAAKESK